jgi:hypothetical protein
MLESRAAEFAARRFEFFTMRPARISAGVLKRSTVVRPFQRSAASPMSRLRRLAGGLLRNRPRLLK